jgi:hypothetical protein
MKSAYAYIAEGGDLQKFGSESSRTTIWASRCSVGGGRGYEPQSHDSVPLLHDRLAWNVLARSQ